MSATLQPVPEELSVRYERTASRRAAACSGNWWWTPPSWRARSFLTSAPQGAFAGGRPRRTVGTGAPHQSVPEEPAV